MHFLVYGPGGCAAMKFPLRRTLVLQQNISNDTAYTGAVYKKINTHHGLLYFFSIYTMYHRITIIFT